MITSVVIPFGKGGIIGGTMLGLGRALGETIAVYLIISPVYRIQLAHPPDERQLRSRRSSRLQFADTDSVRHSRPSWPRAWRCSPLTMVINFAASRRGWHGPDPAPRARPVT